MTHSKRVRWLAVVEAGLAMVGLGCGLGLVASLGGGWAWWLEVFTHWEPWLACGLLVLLPWLIWRRRWICVGLAGVLVVKAAWVLAPWLVPGDAEALVTPGDERTITVVTLNLQVDLGDHRQLVACVLAQDPDLVAVQEITAVNARDLRDLLMGTLPHGHAVVASPTWALGILSRHPLVDVNDARDCGLHIAARVEDPSGAFEFVAVHLEPPVLPRLAHSNRRTLATLAEHLESASGPAIVAGDFNLTPWAPSFRAFVERSGLRDPRRGRGLLRRAGRDPGAGGRRDPLPSRGAARRCSRTWRDRDLDPALRTGRLTPRVSPHQTHAHRDHRVVSLRRSSRCVPSP